MKQIKMNGRKVLFGLLSFTSAAMATPLITITVPSEISGDIYLSSTGTDGGGCSKTSPCRTPGYALPLATPGHNVWILDSGTYLMPVQLTPSEGMHSGTSASRIFFGPVSGQTPTLTFQTNGTGLKWDGVNYWTFHHLNLSVTDMGFMVGENISTTHLQWYQCTGSATGTSADNAGIVEAVNSNADYLDFVQNSWSGPGANGGSNGHAILMLFRTAHLNVIGNKLGNIYNPIYFKHNHTAGSAAQIMVANNVIYSAGRWTDFEGDYSVIQNNLFVDTIIEAGETAGAPGGSYSKYYHNTIYGASRIENGMPTDGGGIPNHQTWQNNVIAAGVPWYNFPYTSNNPYITANYNLYSTTTKFYWNRNTWTTLTSYIAGALWGTDARSVNANPVFVNSSPSLSNTAGFALASGSPGKSAASDGTDMGANMGLLLTTSDPTTASTSTDSPPSAPSTITIKQM